MIVECLKTAAFFAASDACWYLSHHVSHHNFIIEEEEDNMKMKEDYDPFESIARLNWDFIPYNFSSSYTTASDPIGSTVEIPPEPAPLPTGPAPLPTGPAPLPTGPAPGKPVLTPIIENVIRSAIPWIRKLADTYEEWPEAYCDVTSAQIYLEAGGFGYRCGKVKTGPGPDVTKRHVWNTISSMNIDFTAHQFDVLVPYVVDVDGFSVLFGSDEYFTSLGYIMEPINTCEAQVQAAITQIQNGEYGDLDPYSDL